MLVLVVTIYICWSTTSCRVVQWLRGYSVKVQLQRSISNSNSIGDVLRVSQLTTCLVNQLYSRFNLSFSCHCSSQLSTTACTTYCLLVHQKSYFYSDPDFLCSLECFFDLCVSDLVFFDFYVASLVSTIDIFPSFFVCLQLHRTPF